MFHVIRDYQAIGEISIVADEYINGQEIIFTGTYEECCDYHLKCVTAIHKAEQEISEYSIQDDVWPSRKWNKDRTDYIDLSGE